MTYSVRETAVQTKIGVQETDLDKNDGHSHTETKIPIIADKANFGKRTRTHEKFGTRKGLGYSRRSSHDSVTVDFGGVSIEGTRRWQNNRNLTGVPEKMCIQKKSQRMHTHPRATDNKAKSKQQKRKEKLEQDQKRRWTTDCRRNLNYLMAMPLAGVQVTLQQE